MKKTVSKSDRATNGVPTSPMDGSAAASTPLESAPRGPRPRGVFASLKPYAAETPGPFIDLRLDANEGRGPSLEAVLGAIAGGGTEPLRRYPHAAGLEARLAQRLHVEASQVIVTAGGDEAIDRACRAYLSPGVELVLAVPTFSMFRAYTALAEAKVVEVAWPGGWLPVEAMLAAVTPATKIIAVVSPNNPTGAIATADDLRRLSAAAPEALLLVDLAYTEFADEDLSAAALALPNAIAVRTMSKAWGSAGLRVGYAVGPARLIAPLRAAGGPYSVSGVSLQLAAALLESGDDGLTSYVAAARRERGELVDLFASLGASAWPSQGNFVLARFADTDFAWHALQSAGILVRRLRLPEPFGDALRITCPGNEQDFAHLAAALRTALRPEALLWDMDGVLVDVSGSYRRAILETAGEFGVTVTAHDVSQAKAAGGANNDWELTQRLMAQRGKDVPLAEVTRVFEGIYQGQVARNGAPARAGLRETETLIPELAMLERLAKRYPMAIVTGRPRKDCDVALRRFGLERLFAARVTMDDGPLKPDPWPATEALRRLNVTRAWMIGDTPDDITCARRAGVVPVGVIAPGKDASENLGGAMTGAGAARVLARIDHLEKLLP